MQSGLQSRGSLERSGEVTFLRRAVWESYPSADAEIVELRVAEALQPPASVELLVSDGVLEARGVATAQWLEQAHLLSRTIPGVVRFEHAAVVGPESGEERFAEISRRLDERVVFFGRNSADLGAGEVEVLRAVAADLRTLFALAEVLDREVETEGARVNLLIWDLAGEDELLSLRMSYLRGADGCLVVADGTRGETLETAVDLYRRIEAELGLIPFVFVLNKADLREDWEVDEAVLRRRLEGDYDCLVGSAKDGRGVEEAFHLLASKALRTRR